ncbi:MAG: hypothetical protein KC416_10115, partial [Myxococcales bacterium]|nr:hypothetical protein [Myxococcales bacterium]
MTRSLSCLALLAWAAMGCNPQDHVGPDGFYAFGVDEDTAPFLMVEDTPFVFVETRVEIPLR